jgi:hypothetical protein
MAKDSTITAIAKVNYELLCNVDDWLVHMSLLSGPAVTVAL